MWKYGKKQKTYSFIQEQKRLYVPKEDRIVVKDTHEGIVSEEWTQVQQMLDKRKNTNKSGITYDNIFKGLVKCPDCNYVSWTPKKDYRLNKKDTIDFVHFSCSGYKKYGVKACTSHR